MVITSISSPPISLTKVLWGTMDTATVNLSSLRDMDWVQADIRARASIRAMRIKDFAFIDLGIKTRDLSHERNARSPPFNFKHLLMSIIWIADNKIKYDFLALIYLHNNYVNVKSS